MNPQLFELYRQELQHAREMGAEFAAEFPKVAGRLGIEKLECSDPYVERLLEGFAFLAARVQLKLNSNHGELARHLLEMVHPLALAPTPSMVVSRLYPSMTEGSLLDGFTVERGTRMSSQKVPDCPTECEFRTAHDLTLWPISLSDVRTLSTSAAMRGAGLSVDGDSRSALCLTLECDADVPFSELPLDELSLYLTGPDSLGPRLYEQLFRHTVSVSVIADGKEVRRPGKPMQWHRQGFDDNEALLPVSARGFQGHRLVQEYFAFPARFQFLKVSGLQARLKRVQTSRVELVFRFDNVASELLDRTSNDNYLLHCVPAINLFERSADRIHLDRARHAYHVVPDRSRPMDFEIHSIQSVTGHGSGLSTTQRFHPYFSSSEQRPDNNAYFSLAREQRRLSSKQQRTGPRASYIGSEVFVSLVDSREAPYRSDLKQLAVEVLCTNRDLPLQMPVGRLDTDFTLDVGAPVDSIRCVAGPTSPLASRAHERDAWRLVSHLNFNYLSFDGGADDNGESAAAMLRQMLELYAATGSAADQRLLEGIQGLTTTPAVRQRRYRGHVDIAHGIQVRLKVDESAFEGTGAYLLGSVLERFFARYASINSFTETVLESVQRNEIECWPVQLGNRQTL